MKYDVDWFITNMKEQYYSINISFVFKADTQTHKTHTNTRFINEYPVTKSHCR